MISIRPQKLIQRITKAVQSIPLPVPGQAGRTRSISQPRAQSLPSSRGTNLARNITLTGGALLGTYAIADRTLFEPQRRKTQDAVANFVTSPGDARAEERLESLLKERYGTSTADVRNVQRFRSPDGQTISRFDVSFGRTNNPNMPRGVYSMNISQSREANGSQVISLSSPSLAQTVPVNSTITDGMTYSQVKEELQQSRAAASLMQDREQLALLQEKNPSQQRAILKALGITKPEEQQRLMAQFEKEGSILQNTVERQDAFNVLSSLENLSKSTPTSASLPSTLLSMVAPLSNWTGIGKEQVQDAQSRLAAARSFPTLVNLLEEHDRTTYNAVVKDLPPSIRTQYERLLDERVKQEFETAQQLHIEDSRSGLNPPPPPSEAKIREELQRMETLESIIRQYPQPFSAVTPLLQGKQDSANAADVLLNLRRQNPQLFEQLQHKLNQQHGGNAVRSWDENNPSFDPKNSPLSVPQFIPKIETDLTVGQLRSLINQSPLSMTTIRDAINRQQNVAATQNIINTLRTQAPQEYAAVENHLKNQGLWGDFNSTSLGQVVRDLRENSPNEFELYRLMASNYDKLAQQGFVTPQPETATAYLSNGEQPVISQIITQPDNRARVNLASFGPLNINPDLVGRRIDASAPGINVGMSANATSININEVNPDKVREAFSRTTPADPKDLVWTMVKSYGTAYRQGNVNYGVLGFTDENGKQITMHVLSDGSIIRHNLIGNPTRYSPEEAGRHIQEGLQSGWRVQDNSGLILGQPAV